ncbi:MAG: AAA family ATPase [Arenicellales bacterium]
MFARTSYVLHLFSLETTRPIPSAANVGGLYGRDNELLELERSLADAREARGRVVLLAGETGIGKSRLAEVFLDNCSLRTLRTGASASMRAPYAPIRALLRDYFRRTGVDPAGWGPLGRYLAMVLPELGPRPEAGDQSILIEALCHAFTAMAREQPTVVFLDDLQWADNATLDLLPVLARAASRESLLLVVAYRNDQLPRRHPVRRLRTELRRARLLSEVVLEPLGRTDTIGMATELLGHAPEPCLAQLLFERSEGVPFFIEELSAALQARDRLHPRRDGPSATAALAPGEELPVPETVHDAVLLCFDDLPASARDKLAIAAVGGLEVDLALVASVAGDEAGIDELLEHRCLVEPAPGQTQFRHALVRDIVYSAIPWTRRRRFHHQFAEKLEAAGASSERIARHWLAAGEHKAARKALLSAVRQWYALHAYRDALEAARQALELWPRREEERDRLAALEQFAHCAQLCGSLDEAAEAWREASTGWGALDENARVGEAERRRAGTRELQGDWQQALAARQAAAESFALCRRLDDAASERLAAATHLRSAARYSAALELLAPALVDARRTGRFDLEARILCLAGNMHARLGDVDEGLARVREGLALALKHDLAGVAAESHQRLADSLEHGGDYRAARKAYLTGFEFCQTHTLPATAQVCLACLTAVLRQNGEWQFASSLCRDVLAAPASNAHARAVAGGMLGSIHALRGQARRARPLLLESSTLARGIELVPMEIMSAWGLALTADLENDPESLLHHCRFILSRWQQVEDRHYAVAALRWAASQFAASHADADTRACADALAAIANATGQTEALAALAHALGEVAWQDGNHARALEQFSRALDLMHEIDTPYDRAETQLRAGITASVLDQHVAAADFLRDAQRTARQLGARPLATKAGRALARLDEEAVGKQSARRPPPVALTPRQREVLRLVASGLTDKEIAKRLFLSPRTVQMHVAHCLERLDCRSRTEAVHRAGSFGLLED